MWRCSLVFIVLIVKKQGGDPSPAQFCCPAPPLGTTSAADIHVARRKGAGGCRVIPSCSCGCQSFNPSHSPPRKLRASPWRGEEIEVVSPSRSCHRSVGVAQLTGKICVWLVSFLVRLDSIEFFFSWCPFLTSPHLTSRLGSFSHVPCRPRHDRHHFRKAKARRPCVLPPSNPAARR